MTSAFSDELNGMALPAGVVHHSMTAPHPEQFAIFPGL
jgi:hypothetical protein